MKYLTVILALLVHIVNGQTSKQAIYYDVNFVEDTMDVSNIKSDLMVLWSNNEYSVFQSIYAYKRDSAKNNIRKEADRTGQADLGASLALINQFQKPKFTYQIRKDFKKMELATYDKVSKDNLVSKDKLNKIEWELTDDSKYIHGMECTKAITSYGDRRFVAWYTEDIPIQDGPYVFNGLPGLIMEIADDQDHYVFKMVGIEYQEMDMMENIPENNIVVSRKQFFKTKKDFESNIVQRMAERGITLVNAEDAKNVQDRYNKKNNPLELDVL